MTNPLSLSDYTCCLPVNSSSEQYELHECGICQKTPQTNEKITQVTCKHLFHQKRLNVSLIDQKNSPLCKKNIQCYQANRIPQLGNFIPSLLSATSNAPQPSSSLQEAVKQKYASLPHIFSKLSYLDRKQILKKIQDALLKRTLSPIILQRPANPEKFQDYLQAIKSLDREDTRIAFLNKLPPHELSEVLFLLCVSSLSTEESKQLVQAFLNIYRKRHAREYADSLANRYSKQWPDIKQEGESLDFTLIRAIFNPNDDRALLLDLDSPSMQEAFLDFVEACKRLESPEALKFFFQSQPLTQRFFILNLMRNSRQATAESRQLSDSYYVELLPEYLFLLKKYLNTKYPHSSFFHGLQKHEENRLFTQLKAILLDQEPFLLPHEVSKEKFVDFLEFLKRCPSESQRDYFLKSLEDKHLLEVLYLLRHSPYKSEHSLALTQKIVDELTRKQAPHYAKKVLYKHRYNWKGLIHGLYVNNDKNYVIRLKNKVLEGIGHPPLNFSPMKEKFDDFFSALKKLHDPLAIMKFLDYLTEVEKYEILALMNLSTFATAESRRLTHEYLKKERSFYAKELTQLIKRKYENYQSLKGYLDSQKEELAKAYLEKAFFDEGNPSLKMPAPLEEFEEHLALFRNLPDSRAINEYFYRLCPVRQAELLFLMYASSHANDESKKLLKNIYESQKKLRIEACTKELHQKYQLNNAPSSYQGLNKEQRLKLLYSYQDSLFTQAKTPAALDFPTAKQKFTDYTQLFKKLGHVDKWREFLASLKEEEAYEVMALLKNSSYATELSKKYVERYLQDVKYYWQWNQYFIKFYHRLKEMFSFKKSS